MGTNLIIGNVIGTRIGSNVNQKLVATLTATGTGTRVSTLMMEVSETQIFTLDGAARFYTNSAGTTGESTTWEVTAGAIRTIYLKCPSGTANLTIPKPDKVIKWGDTATYGWTSSTNGAKITIEVGKLALTELRITGTSLLIGALPTDLTFVRIYGNSIEWTYNGALPIDLTYLRLEGKLIAWTYTGTLPTKLTTLHLLGNSIVWTYTGALPIGLEYLLLSGDSIVWTYSGALPTNLIYLYLNGSLIAWTGLDVGNNGNINTFSLLSYRIAKMSSPDMVTLLTQLTNRTGSLPTPITINDYTDYASPPASVTDAIAALRAAKPSVQVVMLGA